MNDNANAVADNDAKMMETGHISLFMIVRLISFDF
jgi:hypothetical protein